MSRLGIKLYQAGKPPYRRVLFVSEARAQEIVDKITRMTQYDAEAPDPSVSALAGKVKAFREAQGLKVSELARLASIGESTISRLENDQATPTTMTLLKIARALNVSAADLIETTTGEKR